MEDADYNPISVAKRDFVKNVSQISSQGCGEHFSN